jgi:spore coat protein U-like protein
MEHGKDFFTIGNVRRGALIAGLAMLTALPAQAASDTATFNVTITLQETCDVATSGASNIAFGSQGLLTANVDQTSTLTVTCSEGTDYSIGLNAGLNAGTPADVDTRRMTDGNGNYVQYQLYQDAPGGTVWGNTNLTDTVDSIGTGSSQSFTVHGRVPPQATPPAGAYSDTITATVTY